MHGETSLKMGWVVKKYNFSYLTALNRSKCILMVSLYIWLSIYNNNKTLRIIWKFDLSSRGVLGRIYALSIEVLSKGSVMDINKLYQYITTFNLINITTKNVAINTGRLWRRRVLGQSEIVCTVAILDVQGDTAINILYFTFWVESGILRFNI